VLGCFIIKEYYREGASMKKVGLASVLFILATGSGAYAADNTSQQIQFLNSQIQAQLAKMQSDQQKQIQTLNVQVQTQIKTIQTSLQDQIQKLNTQLQAEIKQVQTNLEQEIKQVQQSTKPK
jgi:hypothetical protein